LTQTIQVHKPKTYKCFTCGEPIIFKTGFNKKRFNLDGTAHICNEDTKKQYRQSDDFKNSSSYQAYLRRLRAYWARKNNYSKYDNTKEKKEAREKSRQKYDEYKRQYYNESLNVDKALEILEIVKDEFNKLNSALRWTNIKTQYRKLALKFHPDKHPKDFNETQKQEYTQKFRECTEAFEKLESVYKI
jgi:hypothetical protein